MAHSQDVDASLASAVSRERIIVRVGVLPAALEQLEDAGLTIGHTEQLDSGNEDLKLNGAGVTGEAAEGLEALATREFGGGGRVFPDLALRIEETQYPALEGEGRGVMQLQAGTEHKRGC